MKKITSVVTALSAAALLSVPVLAQQATTSTTTTTVAPVAPAPGMAAEGTTMTEETSSDTLMAETSSTEGTEGTLQNTGGEPLVLVLGGIVLMSGALLLRRQTSRHLV